MSRIGLISSNSYAATLSGKVSLDGDPLRESSAEQYSEAFLYDLYADPYELTNLIGYESHQGVAEHLRGVLIRRMKEAGEAAPVIEPAVPVPSGQRSLLENEWYE